MTHGTADQKQKYLPRILASQDYWCQGFSEPGSGSDLASLRTAAVKVDGGWQITGEKVWTSNAHNADRCLLLARTDPAAPKHAGITYFLAEMAAVQVSPLTMINGDAEFNQMHFDGVFVSDADVLGGVGGGWPVALTTLAYERGTMALNLWVWARQAVDRAVEVAHEQGLAGDEAVVDQIGALHADAEAVRIGSLRLLGEMQAGRSPGAETSALKLQWAAGVQSANRLAVQLQGPAECSSTSTPHLPSGCGITCVPGPTRSKAARTKCRNRSWPSGCSRYPGPAERYLEGTIVRAVFTDEQLQIEQVMLDMAGHGPKLSRAAVEKGWSAPEFESRLQADFGSLGLSRGRLRAY